MAQGQADSARAGLYVWGAEVETFQPCGSDSVYWVLSSPAVLQQLRKMHQSLTTRPYAPIYVRVRGARSDQKPDGFAEQYYGYYRITRVMEMHRVMPSECKR